MSVLSFHSTLTPPQDVILRSDRTALKTCAEVVHYRVVPKNIKGKIKHRGGLDYIDVGDGFLKS